MRLSGSELRQVHDVVVQAFSLPDLEQVFQFQFDTPLAVAVRVSQPLGSVVFDLLNWAQQRDVLKKLLLALGDERPQSESLGKVLRELGVTRESELPTQTPSSPLPGQPAGGPRAGVGQAKEPLPATMRSAPPTPKALDDAQSRVVRTVLASFNLDELRLLVADHFPEDFRNLDSFVPTPGRTGEAVIADLVSHANAQYLANELVTGLRARRSRDPVVLTLATELGLLGQEPDKYRLDPPKHVGYSLPSAPSERAPRQRAGFISWLETLSDSQFDLLRAAFPLSFSSVPASGPVPQRARTLLAWAEGPRGPGLAPLIQLARALWPQILTGGVPDAAAARADDWAVEVLDLKRKGGRSAEGDSPASAKPRTETRENTQAWEQAAAALRALLQAPASAAGPAPSSAAIHGALDWLAWLRERVPWAPPTAILPLTAGGLLIERETEDEAGHLTTAELSLPNDEAAEFTLFRDHHVVETRVVPREHARQLKAFPA